MCLYIYIYMYICYESSLSRGARGAFLAAGCAGGPLPLPPPFGLQARMIIHM